MTYNTHKQLERDEKEGNPNKILYYTEGWSAAIPYRP